ncbi:MAG: hypothetical protein ACQESC_04560 [Nanobdellota archaeon]
MTISGDLQGFKNRLEKDALASVKTIEKKQRQEIKTLKTESNNSISKRKEELENELSHQKKHLEKQTTDTIRDKKNSLLHAFTTRHAKIISKQLFSDLKKNPSLLYGSKSYCDRINKDIEMLKQDASIASSSIVVTASHKKFNDVIKQVSVVSKDIVGVRIDTSTVVLDYTFSRFQEENTDFLLEMIEEFLLKKSSSVTLKSKTKSTKKSKKQSTKKSLISKKSTTKKKSFSTSTSRKKKKKINKQDKRKKSSTLSKNL